MPAYDTLTEDQELTLPIMRRYYKGKKIVPNRFDESMSQLFRRKDKPYNIECFFDSGMHSLELGYVYMDSWSGEEISYDITISINEDNTIKSISALHGRKFCHSDATSDGYKNIRMGSSDYYILDVLLDFACSPSIQFLVSNNVLYSYSSEKEYSQMEKVARRGGQIYDCIVRAGVLYIPEGVEICDFGAFDDCESVQIVHLPTSVRYIRHGSFSMCDNLKRIFLPASVKKIGVHDEPYVDASKKLGSRGNVCAFNRNDANITVACSSGSLAEKYCRLFDIEIDLIEDEKFEYTPFRKIMYHMVGEFRI